MHDRDIYRQVSDLHVSGLDRSFLTRLGPDFLEILYQAIDESDSGVLIVETVGTTVVGFVAGGAGTKRIYFGMLKYAFRLSSVLIRQILNLSKLKGIIDIIYHSSAGTNNFAGEVLPRHELFSIVVANEHRGTGVAEGLYSKLCDNFRSKGVKEFKILVGEELAVAHNFYRRMGAKPVCEISMHGSKKSMMYVQVIGAEP